MTAEEQPQPRTEARRRSRKENEFLALKALLSGEFLQFSMSVEQRARFRATFGFGEDMEASHSGAVDQYRREWERDGVIVGYVPVLSEKGQEYFKALRTIYGKNGVGKDEPQ